MNVYLLICVVPERKQFVRKGVNRTEKKHTPCTLFSFNGGAAKTLKGDRKRRESRGNALPNNLCHRLGSWLCLHSRKATWKHGMNCSVLSGGFQRLFHIEPTVVQSISDGISREDHVAIRFDLRAPSGAFCDRSSDRKITTCSCLFKSAI